MLRGEGYRRKSAVIERLFRSLVAKVLEEKSKGTLSTVSPIGCMENKAQSRFTSLRIPMPTVWHPRYRSISRDLQTYLQRAIVRSDSTV